MGYYGFGFWFGYLRWVSLDISIKEDGRVKRVYCGMRIFGL